VFKSESSSLSSSILESRIAKSKARKSIFLPDKVGGKKVFFISPDQVDNNGKPKTADSSKACLELQKIIDGVDSLIMISREGNIAKQVV